MAGSKLHIGRSIRCARSRGSRGIRSPARHRSRSNRARSNEYQIEIMATANLFRKGHRICVEITSTDLPTGVGGATNAEYVPNHICTARRRCTKSTTMRTALRICCCPSFRTVDPPGHEGGLTCLRAKRPLRVFRPRSDKDQPLIDDIRLLGQILGDTIREQEGESVFELIETIRRLSVGSQRNTDAGGRRQARCPAQGTELRRRLYRSFAPSAISRTWPTWPKIAINCGSKPWSRRAGSTRTAVLRAPSNA